MVTTTDLDRFAEDACAFLDAHASPRPPEAEFRWGEGSEAFGIMPERTPEEDLAELAAARAWRRTCFDAGYGWLSGPPEYGGAGLTRAHQRTYDRIERRYDTPAVTPFAITYGMVAPTILAHGSDAAKERYLAALYRGDLVACQLFSEPGAGSDLAGVTSRATRDGDEWRLTGQKVWTSGAHYADIGEILVRTSPDAPRHQGLTMFVVDMHQPGVEVRPLRQMTGGASFNEVFFDEARVHEWQRLGDVDGGWSVALTTLMNERAAIGGGGGVNTSGAGFMARLHGLVDHLGLGADPIVRQQLASIHIHAEIARFTTQRALARMRAGDLPGPEMSIGKLQLTANLQRISDLVGQLLGPRLTADTGEWGTFAWNEFLCTVPGLRVAGGTDEVMRNIIAERVLGLPKDRAT